jgi:phosphatidylglycerol:prolipoprotein diacylglycerol transferase
MSYPYAVVGWPHPPGVVVHPTPVYEMLAYFAVFAYLRRQRAQDPAPGTTFATYLILASTARFLVEFVRINPPVLMGLTAAQLTSMALVALGALTLAVGRRWRPAAV